MTWDDIIYKLKADLMWRGPSGREMGHIVLTREEAEFLVVNIVEMRKTNREWRNAALKSLRDESTGPLHALVVAAAADAPTPGEALWDEAMASADWEIHKP